MFISPCNLTDKKKCQALFKRHLLDFLARLPNEEPVKESQGSGSLQRLLRFGQLLGEPVSVVYQDLVVNCIEMGYYDRAQEYFQYVLCMWSVCVCMYVCVVMM